MIAERAAGGSPVKVAFRTLGCKVNRVESDAIAAELIGRGVEIAGEEDAALIVINTCTVTGEADAKARKAVRQALAAPSHPVVVVTGCLAALDASGLRALDSRVVVEADKQRVAQRVADALALEAHAHAGPPLREAAARARTGEGFRTRALLKIEDGCDNFCSYCIIPYARGVPRAVPLQQVIADAGALVEAGVREIVMTGINIGRYEDAGADLTDLVRGVARTGVQRLRLSSIEPPDLTPRLLDTLARTDALCEHLHVPLQSGSDAVLRSMGRSYTADQFERLIAHARRAMPGLAVTTDVIAGFPGETEADHESSLALVARVGFAKVHVFRYSERRGTPAAQMVQLAPEIRAARAAQLRELGERLRAAYASACQGRVAEVLVECVVDGLALGTTRDYLRVEALAPGVLAGEVLPVRLCGERGDRLRGVPVS